MRISDRYQQQHTLATLRAQMEQFQKAQDEATTGLKIRTLSDDPANSAVLMRLEAQLRDVDQYRQNGTQASIRLNTEDAAITAAAKLVDQARQVAEDGSAQSADPATRAGLLAQVKQLLDQLVGIGNTTLGDEHIFAGAATDAPPFKADGTYVGDETVRQVQLDQNLTADVSHPGDQVFGSSIRALQGLMQQLQSNTPGATSASIATLDRAHQDLLQVQVDTGSRLSTVQNSASVLTARQNSMLDQRDQLRAADPTESMVNLLALQSAMERAYSAIGKVLSTHLSDFLK